MAQLDVVFIYVIICLVCIMTNVDSKAKPDLLKKQIGAGSKRNGHSTTCRINCTGSKQRPVCGSDGITYPSRCYIKKLQRCDKKKIEVKELGRCPRCGQAERATFNTNLIQKFSEEYARIPKPTPPQYPGAPKDTQEKRVIEWKFSELDTDKNERLKRKEIRNLKKMVKKVVKPKSCGKKFDIYCDLDQNGEIERKEWSVCLGVDIYNDTQWGKPQLHPGRGGISSPLSDVLSASQSLHSGAIEEPVRPHRPNIPTLIQENPQLQPAGAITSKEESEEKVEENAKIDCQKERTSAIEIDRNDPGSQTFIPECDEKGKFKSSQCYNNLCWCVDNETGHPIPYTASTTVLDCVNSTRVRPFKGCDYVSRNSFITNLLDEITLEIGEYDKNNRGSVPEPNPEHSIEERVIRGKFFIMDKNKNNKLERKELRDFKTQIKRTKNLRKCGRNFIRFCDADDNKEIDMREWIQCMYINDKERKLPDKRQGRNPLNIYLKSR